MFPFELVSRTRNFFSWEVRNEKMCKQKSSEPKSCIRCGQNRSVWGAVDTTWKTADQISLAWRGGTRMLPAWGQATEGWRASERVTVHFLWWVALHTLLLEEFFETPKSYSTRWLLINWRKMARKSESNFQLLLSTRVLVQFLLPPFLAPIFHITLQADT